MKKNINLLQKLIITFIIILTLVLVLLAWLLSIWFKITYFKEKEIQFEKDGEYISKILIDNYYEKNELKCDDLQSIINMASVGANSEITILDKFDEVQVYSSGINNDVANNKFEISSKDRNILMEGNPVEYAGDYYTYIYPILEDNEFEGYIVMTTPLSTISKQLHRIYMIIWISALGAMIFASIVLSLVSKKILINPLAEINSAAKRFANGEVNRRVKLQSKDEIGELANSFNIMAESLEKVENNRREFISNVSHELRSPITSINGFIAGIIDGIIPKDKEGYYLERVYKEIERITRLINDLLDLSAIESGKLKFNIKKIDVNELIRLCIINNEQKIKKKNITLEVNLQYEKCYVNADEDKIIQVITNLLDNAIKYCEYDGVIKISNYCKANKVFTQIYNNGPNISEDEILHIWNRFYKSDKSRTNKISTGLGLSIVRMILMQQGEEVWVKNHPNIGVTFTFSLTKWKNSKINRNNNGGN